MAKPRAIVDLERSSNSQRRGLHPVRLQELQTAEELFALLARTLRNQGERYKRPESLEPEDIETIYRAFEHRRQEAAEVMRELRGEH